MNSTSRYILNRILIMIPTMFGITIIGFVLINLAPGGPLEQQFAKIKMSAASANVSDAEILELKKQYGFDKPIFVRYAIWLENLSTLNFGRSVKFDEPVLDVVLERIPVTLQFGFMSLALIYLISIPLGIAKAVRSGSRFDVWSSIVLMAAYSIPPLIFGILLRQFLANREFLNLFPIAELYSDNYGDLSLIGKVADRFVHSALPLTCYVIGGFAAMSLLMKNSLLDVIRLDYVRTAKAKGLDERTIVYKHALKNALIPILASFGGFLPAFFGGSIIVEEMFNLNGIGLLGYSAILARDYNVIMALIFFQSLLTIFGRLISDIGYAWIDPRVDFQ